MSRMEQSSRVQQNGRMTIYQEECKFAEYPNARLQLSEAVAVLRCQSNIMMKYQQKIRGLTTPLLALWGNKSVRTWVQLQVGAGRENSLLQWSEGQMTLLSEAVLLVVLLVVREPGGLAGPHSAVIIRQAGWPRSPPSQTLTRSGLSQQETRQH